MTERRMMVGVKVYSFPRVYDNPRISLRRDGDMDEDEHARIAEFL
jgi:hypothetical protein